MTGTLRENAAGLRARLDERRGDPGLAALPGDLFAAADLIAGDVLLRTSLADAGQPTVSESAPISQKAGQRPCPLGILMRAVMVP